MGCASSAPMVAAARDEMTKAASGVASEVSEQAEHAAKDAAATMMKTIDTAKDTVSSAVTGITNDLGSVIKDKSEVIDHAKQGILEKLHLVEHVEKDPSIEGPAVSVDSEEGSSAKESAQEMALNKQSSSDGRHDTDADSLKTSTPEPEIEQALANFAAETPPTPKPTFSELEKLAADSLVQPVAAAAKDTAKDIFNTVYNVESAVDPHLELQKDDAEEIMSKEITEWENYADILARTRKYNPTEVFRRIRLERQTHSGTSNHYQFRDVARFKNDLNGYSDLYGSNNSLFQSNRSSARSVRSGILDHGNDVLNWNDQDCINTTSHSLYRQDIGHHFKKSPASIRRPIDPSFVHIDHSYSHQTFPTGSKRPNFSENKRKENLNNLHPQYGANSKAKPSLYKVRERCAVCCNKYKV